MDMSSTTTSSTTPSPNDQAEGGGDMDGWKPYLHTSLFSPGAFSNIPDSGEAFLFPSFRIYSRTTFLLACLFTFSLALIERYLSYLLESTFSLHPKSVSKRKNSNAASVSGSGGGVYITIPSNLQKGRGKGRTKRGTKARLLGRTAVYFVATLIRYVLMIIGMGMDWFLLLSLVSGLTLGHALTDVYVSASIGERGVGEGTAVEEVELLPHPDRDESKAELAEGGEREWLHRRSSSRQGVTPF